MAGDRMAGKERARLRRELCANFGRSQAACVDAGLVATRSYRLSRSRFWLSQGLKSLARRYLELHDEIAHLDAMIAAIVDELAPNLVARNSIGHTGAAQLLLTSPVTMSLFDQGISGAMMTSIAVSPSMAKMTATVSVESD